jgi:RNA polymerase sigma-70 factor (ECF subfamily)
MELRQLIFECAKGSITAQRYLFDGYAHRYLLLCQRYLKHREEAEEAMMNGFLQIYQALPQFNFINDPSTIAWMKKIMVNKCLETFGPVTGCWLFWRKIRQKKNQWMNQSTPPWK